MLDSLFGPLDRKYCDYFYVFSAMYLVVALLILVSSLMMYFSSKNGKVNMAQLMLVVFTYLLMYFQNRLLYSMCYKSL